MASARIAQSLSTSRSPVFVSRHSCLRHNQGLKRILFNIGFINLLFFLPLAKAALKIVCHSTVKIYTKTGDKGSSALFTGERRPKDDPIFCALGATDELNAHIGVANEHCVVAKNGLSPKLSQVQCVLFDLGSHLATPRSGSKEDAARMERTTFSGEFTTELEQWIDAMEEQLPALRNFILPSGGLASAHLHVARTVCRRAERTIVPLVRDGLAVPEVGIYMNRLSDFLFVSARFAAMKEGKPEIVYKKPRVSSAVTRQPQQK